MFVDSIRGFKEIFYIVRLLTQLAVDNLFESELDTDQNGIVRRDEEGNEIT
ncbi:hypothetical protein A2U01_0114309, partial [Trifolium medium]|nr:hypothetical protein [Trifolium medium]